MAFIPILTTLPPSQRSLWPELGTTPKRFTLYGGTALALRLGHRVSVDFDFFSNLAFDPDQLANTLPYLKDAERIQVAPNTLTCRIQRAGPVLISFFGGLDLGQVAASDEVQETGLQIASLLDLAGTKAAVIQKRAEVKDYLDLDALLQHGLDLPTVLAAGRVVYGHQFNPLITLKALSYFDDVSALPSEVQARLRAAVARVEVTDIPLLTPYAPRPDAGGIL